MRGSRGEKETVDNAAFETRHDVKLVMKSTLIYLEFKDEIAIEYSNRKRIGQNRRYKDLAIKNIHGKGSKI